MRWILTCKGCIEPTGMSEWTSFYDGCGWTSCCSMSLYTFHLLYVSLRGLYISVGILFHNKCTHMPSHGMCLFLSSLKHICQSLDLILSGPDFCIMLPVLWFRLGIPTPVSNCLLWICTLRLWLKCWGCLLCRVSQVWQTWEEATSPGRRVDFLSNFPKLKKHYPDIRYRICPYHDV